MFVDRHVLRRVPNRTRRHPYLVVAKYSRHLTAPIASKGKEFAVDTGSHGAVLVPIRNREDVSHLQGLKDALRAHGNPSHPHSTW